MKKMLLLSTMTVLSGCSSMLGSSGIEPGYQTAATVMEPTEGYYSNGKPRPYSVTSQDQVKYEELTKKIQNRQHTMNNPPSTQPNKSAGNETRVS